MALVIHDIAPRRQYTAEAGQTVFAVPFEFFANQDIKVYRFETLLGLDSSPDNADSYALTGAGVTGGGHVTLGPPGCEQGDIITVVRDVITERQTDFPLTGPFNIEALNLELDRIVTMIQEVEVKLEQRALMISEWDTPADIYDLPRMPERANKLLAFDSEGQPIATTGEQWAVAATAQHAEFTATAGQTTFHMPTEYAVGYLGVHVNGVLLASSEFTATGPTAVIIHEPLQAGDIVALDGFLGSDVAGSANGLMFIQAGTGAVTRTAQDKMRESVSVKDFGAIGDGVADDTAAINAAIAAHQDKTIYFPAGTYLYSGGGWLANGTVLVGDGAQTTTIKVATAGVPYLFQLAGYRAGIRSMGFEAGVPQTSGTWVDMPGTWSFLDDFYMNGDLNGIKLRGAGARVRDGTMLNNAPAAVRISVQGGDTSPIIDDVLIGAPDDGVNSATCGILVGHNAGLMITNTSVLTQGIGLLINPAGAGQGCFSLYVENCFFDTCTRGMVINPTASGEVSRCRFADCWFGSASTDGVLLQADSPAKISGIHFESPHVVLNTGSGITVGGNACSDIAVVGGEFCANNYGIWVGAAMSGLKVIGATIGAGAGLAGNTQLGIVLDAVAISNVVITDNVMVGNGAAAISNNSTGSNVYINNNPGSSDTYNFAPVLKIGGSAAGITTSLADGVIYKQGHKCEAEFRIILISKGAGVGNVTIGGFPAFDTAGKNVTGAFANLANLTGLTGAMLIGDGGASGEIGLFQSAPVGIGVVTNANLTNTSVIFGHVSFYI